MKQLERDQVPVPAGVADEFIETYKDNYLLATKGTGNMMLFAGDQKIEHLNDDYVGEGVHADDADPEHFFRIASKATIGCFAGQHGLIARYGPGYTDVPYLVKINSKTNLIKVDQRDPISLSLVDIEHVLELRDAGLKVVGVGYTIYVGSEFEAEMLAEAARLIADAHRYGLLVVLWMYPRGKAVPNERDPHLIAGAAGIACAIGADFAKVNYPKADGNVAELFREATVAAGKTGIITSGGSATDVRQFLQRTHDQIHISGCVGNATGRNIHQKGLDEAVRMCNAISAITLGEKNVDFAMKVFHGEETFTL